MSSAVAETLLVEISARTVQLEARLAAAEGKLARFESTAKKTGDGAAFGLLKIKSGIEPTTIALTAMGAAMLGVAAKATMMAAQTDGALRQISAASPGVGRNLAGIREELEGVAQATGRSREEIFHAAGDIARLGVASEAELKAKLSAATLIADATGTELKTAVDGIDQLGDAFDLSTDQMVTSIAKLASAARGKVDFDSIFGAFTAATPRIQKLGLDFDTSVRATVALLDRGMSARKVAGFFNDHDAAAIRAVAKEAKISARALDELKEAADFRRGGGDREFQRQLNMANASLEDLGVRILPIAISAMKQLVEVMDHWSGRAAQDVAASGQRTIATVIARSAKQRIGATSLEDVKGALHEITGVGLDLPIVQANNKAAEFTTEQLRAMSAGYQLLLSAASEAKLKAKEVLSMRTSLRTITTELQKRDAQTPGLPVASTASGTSGGGGRRGLPLSEEEKAKAAELAKQSADAAELIRKSFADIRLAAEQDIGQGTKSAFDNALASLDKFTEEAAQNRTKLVAALNGQVKQGKLSKADATITLAGFDDDVIEEQERRYYAAKRVLQNEQKAIEQEVQQTLAALTGNATQALELADEATRKKLKESGASPEQLKQIEQLQARLRGAKVLSADVDKVLAQIEQSAANGMGPMQQMHALTEQENKLLAERAELMKDAAHNGEALEINQAGLTKIEAERGKVVEKNTQYLKAEEEYAASLTGRTHAWASALAGAADVAYGLIATLGRGDEQLSRMVTSVQQLASGIAKATGPGGFGALSMLEKFSVGGSIIGGAINLGQTLLGSNDDKALRANTEAIQELTKKAGLLGETVLGGRDGLTAVRIAERLKQTPGFEDLKGSKAFPARVNGLTNEQLAIFKKAAADLGVAIDYSGQSWRDAANAILAAAGKLGEFSDDWESLSQMNDARRKIFGDDTPEARLHDISVDAVKASSPALKELFAGITNLTDPASLELLRKRVQDLFTVMEPGGTTLTKEQLGELTGDQLVQALEDIIASIDELSPKAQTAAEKLAAARSALSTEFDILDTDTAEQLQKVADLYGAKGGALAKLVDGLDTSKAESVAALKQRIEDLFLQLKTAPDSVDLAGMSIDELIAALLDLKHGADAAASGIKSAAQQLQDAANSLKTDFEVYGTDATAQAQGVAALYAGVGGIGAAIAGLDLTTEAGRAAAIAALQQLYGSDKGNSDQTSAILEVLRALRAVPGETAAEAASPSAARPETQTSGAEKITIQQADRLIFLTESLLIFSRQTAQNTAFLSALAGVLRPASAYSALQPPALSLGTGAAGSGSAPSLVMEVRVTNVNHFLGDVSAAQADTFGDVLGTKNGEAINRYIGQRWINQLTALGDPTARGT